MRKIAMVELLLAGAIFSGCAALGSQGGSSGASGIAESAATSAAPGPSLFNFVGRSTKFVFVSPSALLADSSNVEKSLVQEQCMFHNADPPFLVPTFNQKWLFVGHMNQGPTIQALEYRSIFTLGLSGPQQLNSWPVSLVSLSDFSDDYLAERLPVVGKAQPDVRSDVLAEYIANSKRIRYITDSIIRNYNPQVQCGPRH
ncbi:MAG TPA: hypothetical protein VGP23_12310 [Candidatus Binataceae bacterium]|jgi:hypothetical protein|nr:hypothetical protein [Candidatus Binataceae bacterium]